MDWAWAAIGIAFMAWVVLVTLFTPRIDLDSGAAAVESVHVAPALHGRAPEARVRLRSIRFAALTATAAVVATVVASLAVATVAGAAESLELRVRGHYFTAPATLRITVAVEPDDTNRRLRIEADGEHQFQATEVTLGGDGDARLHTIEFKNLPAGAYTLRAELFSSTNLRAVATHQVHVSGVAPRR